MTIRCHNMTSSGVELIKTADDISRESSFILPDSTDIIYGRGTLNEVPSGKDSLWHYIFLYMIMELFSFKHSSDNKFLEFLHEYCKEKSETVTKFKNSFVVT